MLVEKKAEFCKLFEEFINSYLYTRAGLRHTAAYNEQRQQGKRNFEAISSAFQSGEEVTEAVLLQLLPYDKSANNVQRGGAWIHQAAAITKDIKEWFEEEKWTKPEDWQKVAQAILNFIRRCHNKPTQLSAVCQEFSESLYSRGFQTGMLTPILNALRPDNFLLINNQSRRVINYFANTSYSQNLTDYPAINITGRKLIKELAQYMHIPGVPALRYDDLFDMFCHWLVAIKKYDFYGEYLPQTNEVVESLLGEDMNLQPEYTLAQCAEDTGIKEETLKFWLQALERKQQAIFYGPPGTGKTYIAKKLAKHLIGGGDGFIDVVQFHPAYAYEDFVQGIRPQRKNGELDYPLVNGRFLEFCQKARNCQNICVLIIDEINRANVARVFGELMYLLEYRTEEISLASGEVFSIPDNVRIIGTMNTADRSIALVDHALRRRFAFISLYPNYEILRRYHAASGFLVEGLIQILKQLNQQIGNPHYEIGISFFLRPDITQQIESIWQLEIEPYLEEYFFDQASKVNQFRWDKVKQQVGL
ncbi:MAG: AAA family ATPase [Nostocaceae cyanobacterium]|nr:AAA family ATPase [Nostocaceae cyanobacterium]